MIINNNRTKTVMTKAVGYIVRGFAATAVLCSSAAAHNTRQLQGFARTGFSSSDIRGFETAQNIQLPLSTKKFPFLSEYVLSCPLSISGKSEVCKFGHIRTTTSY